jgi:threonine dehydratase
VSAVQGEGLVGLTEVEAAARRLQGVAVLTPLLPCDALSDITGAQVRLKCESLQRAGSFKIRGAYNFVSQLSDQQVERGIITYSSGNHAQAVALAGKLRGVRVVVVMPTTAPEVKRAGAVRLGAEVVFEGTTSVERKARAEAIAAAEGLAMVPPFDHRHIIAGQGTVGLEIVEDMPAVDTVLAPVGGGGLISGVAIAVKAISPRTRVVAVEPELAGDLAEGFRRGERVVWDPALTGRTVADGVRLPAVGELTWQHITRLVDDVVTVSEQSILDAMAVLARSSRLVAEPSGALAVAAYLERPEAATGRTVAVVSGGNVDPQLLAQALTA